MHLMKGIAVLVVLAVASLADAAQVAHEKTKQQIATSVETHRDELIRLADQVWEHAEIALREEKSAEVLASYLEKQRSRGEPRLAGRPTPLVAG